jgi:hypothetical protein
LLIADLVSSAWLSGRRFAYRAEYEFGQRPASAVVKAFCRSPPLHLVAVRAEYQPPGFTVGVYVGCFDNRMVHFKNSLPQASYRPDIGPCRVLIPLKWTVRLAIYDIKTIDVLSRAHGC